MIMEILRKIFLNMTSFISMYGVYSFFFIATYFIYVLVGFNLLHIDFFRIQIYDYINYFTVIVFIALLMFSIIIKKPLQKEDFSNYYLAALFFCIPTINSSITQYYDKIEFGFGEIYPFGFGIISFFIKKVNTGDIQYSNDFNHKFNPDIFNQLFQNQWVMLQAVSLIVAILFIVLYRKWFKKRIL